MSRAGAAPRAAVPVSNARAEAARRNGAKSRGPKTSEGKARSSRNALKHGLRAVRHVVLPQEDAVAFADLQRALFKELAPIGALQTVLARRVAVAAWRLERADRMEAEVLEFRSYDAASPGLALMRDGNATRAVETLLRYRNAAMAEFTRCLRTLQALQAPSRATEARRATLRTLPAKPKEPRKARRNNDVAFQEPADRCYDGRNRIPPDVGQAEASSTGSAGASTTAVSNPPEHRWPAASEARGSGIADCGFAASRTSAQALLARSSTTAGPR